MGKVRRRPKSGRKRRRRSRSKLSSHAKQRKQQFLPNEIFKGSSALKPSFGGVTGRGAPTPLKNMRGRGTFWNDIDTTYFKKLSSEKITTVFDSIRHPKEDTGAELRSFGAIQDSNPFLSRHLDEFFSFYGFYQDVVNELQDNCNYEGKY